MQYAVDAKRENMQVIGVQLYVQIVVLENTHASWVRIQKTLVQTVLQGVSLFLLALRTAPYALLELTQMQEQLCIPLEEGAKVETEVTLEEEAVEEAALMLTLKDVEGESAVFLQKGNWIQSNYNN